MELLECKYRLNVNHAYLFFCHLLFPQTLDCINKFNVIVLGVCVCACVPLFSLLLYVYMRKRLG